VPGEPVEKFWGKIFLTMNHEPPQSIGRASGCIPVYDDGEWRVFKNCLTIPVGGENCADPEKVDVLRQYVVSLLGHYSETIPELEKLGVRVRALLNKQIKTFEDVVAWAESPFNSGPVSKQPPHVDAIIELAYDDILIEVKTGKDPVYVIPAGPRGSGVNETLDFSVPGSKKRYGQRHEFTTLAFSRQVPKPPRKYPRKYRGQPVAEGEPQRPRGRPRLDGLTPGSPEAKRADRKKRRERDARRAAREAKRNGGAEITELPKRGPRLVRVGAQRKEATS
jgi:hypothetical protein